MSTSVERPSQAVIKERPILFSGPMVRAILDGRKTQTRRTVKAKDSDPKRCITMSTLMANVNEWRLQNGRWFGIDGYDTLVFADCPYGQVGNRLWVRETWSPRNDLEASASDERRRRYCLYRADGTDLDDEWHEYDCWRPSIFMPRWASRITLEITGVRVERLGEISQNDAISEGALTLPNRPAGEKPPIGDCPRQRFKRLWFEINGEESWLANPWVWVIEFKRLPS